MVIVPNAESTAILHISPRHRSPTVPIQTVESNQMGLTKQLLTEVLRSVPVGQGTRDLVGEGVLVWAAACDAYASVKILAEGMSEAARQSLARSAQGALQSACDRAGHRLDLFTVEFVDRGGRVIHIEKLGPKAGDSPEPVETPRPDPRGIHRQAAPAGHTPIGGLDASSTGLAGVRRAIAVGAGKGGVGKSTVALNVAVGLSRRGHAVGLLDADIYGPSMPTMLGIAGEQPVLREGLMEPLYAHGVKCITMGALVQPDKPLIWRGPMAHGAFKQLLEQTRWGPLDYLIIDLPPGTGDVSLTMAQALRLTGAIVVCTPQKVAQDDASRAARMFEQLGVEVLGVVENMSYFVGDDGKVYDLFGRGGAEHMARRLNVPFLGAIPITTSLRVNSDAGNPTANFTASDRAGLELARTLENLVAEVERHAALAEARANAPKLTVR
jgi:ATP-binding protein involved in chromosome partitioning